MGTPVIKSACLLPYCPVPVDSGARSIFNKHLTFLRDLGRCSILSAKRRPVGYGWSAEAENELLGYGHEITFRKASVSSIIPRSYGIAYALLFKALKQEKAFGHSNPYHRYAFDSNWLYQQTKGVDLCEIHYSYWARLDTACPKVVIVHDLWSDIMWEGAEKETAELNGADLLVTVSYDDKAKLSERGLRNVHWSPPCIAENSFEDSSEVVVVGSDNRHNIEGLDWLKKGLNWNISSKIHCYGALDRHVEGDGRFIAHGSYRQALDPYRRCGIVLMLTKEGTGLQIKGVEALAAGRAIIARQGAMRGLPRDQIGWIEVDSPEEMEERLIALVGDRNLRIKTMEKAHAYYQRHLEQNGILSSLRRKYLEIRR